MSTSTPSDDGVSTTGGTSAPFLTSLNAGLAGSIVSSNTATQAFPTIPIEDDPTPPDTNGYALVDDIADFARPIPGIQPVTADPAGAAQQYGKDMAFDFGTGEPFGLATGNLLYVEDDIQVLTWIQKCLMTPQGQYLIYPDTYGSILRQITGEGGPEQTVQSEVSRSATSCMLAHPRVRAASVNAILRQPLLSPNALFIQASVTLDSDDDPVSVTLLGS